MTYEADARGYRVKATAVVVESDQIAAATTTRRTETVSGNKAKLQEPDQQEKIHVDSEPATEVEGVETLELRPEAIIHELIPIKKIEKLLSDPAGSGSGSIKFREPKTNNNFGSAYNLGYPFMSGNFIYAL